MYHHSKKNSTRRVRPKSAIMKRDHVPTLHPGTVVVDFSTWATSQPLPTEHTPENTDKAPMEITSHANMEKILQPRKLKNYEQLTSSRFDMV